MSRSGRGVRRAAVAAAALLGAAVGACGPEPVGLEEDAYVEIMAHLTWNTLRHIDAAAADSARAAVLDRFGVTGDELVDFAERHGSDVDRMYGVWERIRARVDSLDARRTDLDDGMLRPDSSGGASS